MMEESHVCVHAYTLTVREELCVSGGPDEWELFTWLERSVLKECLSACLNLMKQYSRLPQETRGRRFSKIYFHIQGLRYVLVSIIISRGRPKYRVSMCNIQWMKHLLPAKWGNGCWVGRSDCRGRGVVDRATVTGHYGRLRFHRSRCHWCYWFGKKIGQNKIAFKKLDYCTILESPVLHCSSVDLAMPRALTVLRVLCLHATVAILGEAEERIFVS